MNRAAERMRQTSTSPLTRLSLASTSDWPSTLNSPDESHLPPASREDVRGESRSPKIGDGEVQKETRGHDVNQQVVSLPVYPGGFWQRWKSITRSMM